MSCEKIWLLYLILICIDEEEVDNESHSVLEIHHQKNWTILPPNPHSLRQATWWQFYRHWHFCRLHWPCILNSPQSNNEETPRVATPPFHSTSTGSVKAHPVTVSQQQSATSSTHRVAPNTHKTLSHAPSSSASHGNHATQSSSGAQASHLDQPSSQAHGNIRSGNTRNTIPTSKLLWLTMLTILTILPLMMLPLMLIVFKSLVQTGFFLFFDATATATGFLLW